jgi:ATP-dependent DNA helicase PIF1
MNLDSAEIDLSRAFTPGMGYVALSRLRKVDGLYLRGFNAMALEVSPEVSEYDAHLKQQSDIVARSLGKLADKQLEELHGRIRTNLSGDYAEYDRDLFEALRQWRIQEASSNAKPAFTVFDDKTLIALSAERPATPQELILVPGIGPKKLEQYGDVVLEIIGRHSGKLF